MKLFAMTATNGDPIPETCLCLDHFDKRLLIHPPIDVDKSGWTNKTEPGLKCIWCGATADTEADKPFRQAVCTYSVDPDTDSTPFACWIKDGDEFGFGLNPYMDYHVFIRLLRTAYGLQYLEVVGNDRFIILTEPDAEPVIIGSTYIPEAGQLWNVGQLGWIWNEVTQ